MSDNKSKICKHYVNGKCKHGDTCTFEHVDDVCRDYFNNNCTRANCVYKHISNSKTHEKTNSHKSNKSNKSNKDNIPNIPNKHKKRTSPYGIKKNTETFEPWYDPADMSLIIKNAESNNGVLSYNKQISSRDVVVIQNLFSDMDDVYNKILREIENIKNDKIWIEWHGSTHLIANDHEKWKEYSATFNKIIERFSKYFEMDIKATRLNWYSSSDYKSFHHDAAAIDEKKAKTQNFTVGVSFGETRSVEFQHAKTRTTINISLENGMTYGFSKDVNIQWRHGIPPLPKEMPKNEKGRISIIAWGWVKQVDV